MSIELPKIGIGTWQLKPPQCKIAVLNALKVGYRLIDTAQGYRNEQAVGEAIAEASIPRNELFLATKVFPLSNPGPKILKCIDSSLKKLRVDCLDLLYIHFPAFGYKAASSLNAISQLIDEGKVRNIGVSNFTLKLMDEAITACNKAIFALQVRAPSASSAKRFTGIM